MSAGSKKDRLIEEAQKHVLKGQFDKAVKLYEQIMSLDPSAINLRQKYAELMIKAGRVDDARKEFETIGKYFSGNGFYLKAIAVYKQLQKLFPADLSISLTLAELNEKHGLTANALAEYKLVCDSYEKSGNIPEYLKVLDKMQNVEPGNVPIKIKLAEAYSQNSRKNEAYSLFVRSAVMLQERGDIATLSRLAARVQQLFPEKTDYMIEVITEQVTNGNAACAVNSLQTLLRSNPNDKRVWDLTVETYRRIQQPQKVKLAYQHYLKLFPNDPVPMLGHISCASDEGNLTDAIELLDRFENTIISAGLADELNHIYQSLANIDPINVRLIEGMIGLARATNRESDVFSLSSKLQSLKPLSDMQSEAPPQDGPAPDFKDEVSDFSFEETGETFTATGLNLPDFANVTEAETTVEAETAVASPQDEQRSQPDFPDDLEIEIELDIDENPEELIEPAGGDKGSADDNWLDSVGGLFDSISTSPRGVRFGDEMDSADTQSHFDLGLAFREMGLYDEAINEFRQAAQDSSRRLACLTMQGACLRDRGEHDTAINVLSSLLKPGLGLEESSMVKYELALTYESYGDTAKATQYLNEIVEANPGFRDVTSRLNAANLEVSLDFSDEELKNF